jgi:hypothetical protein
LDAWSDPCNRYLLFHWHAWIAQSSPGRVKLTKLSLKSSLKKPYRAPQSCCLRFTAPQGSRIWASRSVDFSGFLSLVRTRSYVFWWPFINGQLQRVESDQS